jgi:hypothetical protein
VEEESGETTAGDEDGKCCKIYLKGTTPVF